MDTLLDIVDDKDVIIGQALRSEVHAKGYLHREANVLFITSSGGLILQKRSLSKENNPGLLAATVGGHVESGDDYLITAVKETYEETGIQINPAELIFLGLERYKTVEPVNKTINDALRAFYGYHYSGSLSDLKIEKGEADGFETILLSTMFALSEKDKARVAISLQDEKIFGDIYAALGKLVS